MTGVIGKFRFFLLCFFKVLTSYKQCGCARANKFCWVGKIHLNWPRTKRKFALNADRPLLWKIQLHFWVLNLEHNSTVQTSSSTIVRKSLKKVKKMIRFFMTINKMILFSLNQCSLQADKFQLKNNITKLDVFLFATWKFVEQEGSNTRNKPSQLATQQCCKTTGIARKMLPLQGADKPYLSLQELSWERFFVLFYVSMEITVGHFRS